MEDSATSVQSSLWASLSSWFTSTVFFILLNLMIATIVFTSNLPNNNNQPEQEEQRKLNSHNHQNQPQIARSPSILHRLKSLNFYPQKSHHESSPETHHNQEPIEVAATEYVFNQPLHYQHFDFDSTDNEQLAAAADQFSSHNQTNEIQLTDTETHVGTVMTHFDFEPTRVDTGFDFDPATNDEHTDGFQSLDEVYSKLKGGGVHHDRTKSDSALPPKPPAKMKKSVSMKVGFSNLEKEEIVEARRPATVRERKSAVEVVEDDSDDDVEVDAKADDFINKFKNDLKLQRIESIIRTKGMKN